MTQELILVSEAHAADMTNTSIATLEQFSVAGLLKPIMQDGNIMYSIENLEKLFHTKSDTIDASLLSGRQDSIAIEPSARNDELSNLKVKASEQESTLSEPSQHDAKHVALSQLLERITIDASGIEIVRENQSLSDQLDELKQERDWLRRRLENAETRIEREQMLLISKSETIRQLVIDNNKKSHFWDFARTILKPFENFKKSTPSLEQNLEEKKITVDR